jgi:primary-amine oxidase
MIEKNALEDEGVKAEIAKLQLPEGTVICADPWIYGKAYPHTSLWNDALTMCCRIRWHQRR